MTKEQIQEAYSIAKDYINDPSVYPGMIEEVIQIAFQLAINGEVLYNEDGTIQRIE